MGCRTYAVHTFLILSCLLSLSGALQTYKVFDNLNNNYTCLILYSDLYSLFSQNYPCFLVPLSKCCSDLVGLFFFQFIHLSSSPFPGAAQTCSVFYFPIYLYFLAPLFKFSHAWSVYSLLKYSYFLASLSR